MSSTLASASCSSTWNQTATNLPQKVANRFKSLISPDLTDLLIALDEKIQRVIVASGCLPATDKAIEELRIVEDIQNILIDYQAFTSPFFKDGSGQKKLFEISEEELGNLIAFIQVQDIYNSLKSLNPNQTYLVEIQKQIQTNHDLLKKIFVNANEKPTQRAIDCEYGYSYIDRTTLYDYSPGRIHSNPMIFNVIRIMAIFFAQLTIHDLAVPTRIYLSNELMLGGEVVLKNSKFRDSTVMMEIFNLLNHYFSSNKTLIRRNRLRLDPFDTFQEIKTKLMLIDDITKKLEIASIFDYKRNEGINPIQMPCSSSTEQIVRVKNGKGSLPSPHFDNICFDLGRAYLEKFSDCPLYLHQPFLGQVEGGRNDHYLLHSLHRIMKFTFQLTIKLLRHPPKILDLFEIIDDQATNQVIYQRNSFKPIEYPQRLSETRKEAVFSYQFVKSYELSNYFIENKLILGTTQDPVSITKELIKEINKDVAGSDCDDSLFLKMTNHFHQGTEIKLRRLLGEIYTNMGQNFPISIAGEFPYYHQIFKDKQGNTIYRLVAVANLYVQDEISSHTQKIYHVMMSDYMANNSFDGYHSATYISVPFADQFDQTGNLVKRATLMVMEHFEKILSEGSGHLHAWEKFQGNNLSNSSGIYPALFSPVQGHRKSSYSNEVQIIKEEGKKLPYDIRANLEYHFRRLCANPHEISIMMRDNMEGLNNLKELAAYFVGLSNPYEEVYEEASQIGKYAYEFIRVFSHMVTEYDLLSDMNFLSDKIEIPRDKITEAQNEFYTKLPPQQVENQEVADTLLKKKYMTHVDRLEEIKNTCTNLSGVFRFEIDGNKSPILIADEFIDALSKACKKQPPMSAFTFNGKTTQIADESDKRSMIKLNSFFQGRNSAKYRMALIDHIYSKKDSIHIVKPLANAIKSKRTQEDVEEVGTLLAGEICETSGGIRKVNFAKLELLLIDSRVKGNQSMPRAILFGVKKIIIESIRTLQERIFRDLVIDAEDRIKFKEALGKLSYQESFLDLRGIYIIAQLCQAHKNMPIYCFKSQIEQLNESLRLLEGYRRFSRV